MSTELTRVLGGTTLWEAALTRFLDAVAAQKEGVVDTRFRGFGESDWALRADLGPVDRADEILNAAKRAFEVDEAPTTAPTMHFVCPGDPHGASSAGDERSVFVAVKLADEQRRAHPVFASRTVHAARFDALTLGRLPLRSAGGQNCIDLWISPRHPLLVRAFAVRIAPLCPSEAVSSSSVVAMLCGTLPAALCAVAQRDTRYGNAINACGCGFGENVESRIESLLSAQGLGISPAMPPLGAPFDGIGPSLLCELLVSIWREVVLDQRPAFPPNGQLADDPATAAPVEAEVAAWRSSVRNAPAASPSALVDAAVAGLAVHPSKGGLSDAALSRLLGLRLTPGSVDAVDRGVAPVGLPSLFAAFEVPHQLVQGQLMSVGARALAKHCQRDKSASWWLPGPMGGTQPQKNQMGLAALARVLRECAWANIHLLPHDIVTYELRCSGGYGARWVMQLPSAADGDGDAVVGLTEGAAPAVTFRGFLEPQDPDGHSKGWHH
jgi:hypothetical protein